MVKTFVLNFKVDSRSKLVVVIAQKPDKSC